MKKLIIPILLIISLSTQAQQLVNLGSGPNLRDGDPIRTAFQKHNTNVTDLYATKAPLNSPTFTGLSTFPESGVRIGVVTVTANGTELNILDGALVSTAELNYLVGVTSGVQSQLNTKAPITNPTFAGVVKLGVNDTAASQAYARLHGGGVDPEAVGVQIADSNAKWINEGYDADVYLDSMFANVTGGSPPKYLQFIVGVTTGAPGNGDSVFTHSSLIGMAPKLYRGTAGNQMYRQRFNQTATNGYPGFRFNSTTGTITTRPTLSTGDNVMVEAISATGVEFLTFSAGASSLLDSLMGSYNFNETSGTVVADQSGHQNATSDATASSNGKIGYARQYDGTNAVTTYSYNSSKRVAGSKFSVSLWVNVTTLPSTLGHESYLYRLSTGASSPYETIYLTIGTDNHVYFYAKNTSETDFSVGSSGTITSGSYHHIVGVVEAGQPMKLYIDNVDVSSGAETFTGTFYPNSSLTYMGNAYSGAGVGLAGYLDMVYERRGMTLSSGDVSSLWNGGAGIDYPY